MTTKAQAFSPFRPKPTGIRPERINMKNTDIFYRHVLQFQEKRQAIADEYERAIGEVRQYEGSKFFADVCEKARGMRDKALTDLQAEYRVAFGEDLQAMREASSKRKAKALTGEQLRILQTLQMRDGVTRDEVEAAAHAMKGNLSALTILSGLAQKSGLRGVMRFYDGAMARDDTADVLQALENGTRDFLASDVGRAARIAARYRQRVYGASGVALPKRKPIETKEACFQMLASLNPDRLNSFSVAVDGEGDQDGEE